MAQNQALLKILDSQQKLAEVVTQTISSSKSLTNDLKKKIKKVKQELATIASTVKDMSVSFPLLGQKEKKKTVVVTTPVYREIPKDRNTGLSNVCLYLPTNPDNRCTKICLYP